MEPHPVNNTVDKGERVSFQCRVRSKLPPTVKWIKKIDPAALRIFDGKLPNDTLRIANNYYLFLPAQEVSKTVCLRFFIEYARNKELYDSVTRYF